MSTLLTKNLPDNQLHFWKMHGAGNDFVVLDALSAPLPDGFDFALAARTLCTRHFGVGSDGLLLLDAPDSSAAKSTSGSNAEIRMRMWNPDGSEDMCGNGLRCIARLAHDLGHLESEEFTVQTIAGPRRCKVLGGGSVRVEMGAPLFGLEEIPMKPFENGNPQSAIEYSLPVGERTLEGVTSLSTGSTHTVIFREQAPTEAEFEALSPQIENHPYFPERTSVLWAYPPNGSTFNESTSGNKSTSGSKSTSDGKSTSDESTFRVRIWERGAGETLACGTGACAVAVAAQVTGRAEGPVTIESRGGALKIDWDSADWDHKKKGQPIFMTGPTQIVFRGVFSDGFSRGQNSI